MSFFFWLTLLMSPVCAALPNPVVVGSARFTVTTPSCIRLEYAPNGQFVDAPSLQHGRPGNGGDADVQRRAAVPFGALPDDGKTPLTLHFPPKTITSLMFRVSVVKAGTENAGLSEIAVYRAKEPHPASFLGDPLLPKGEG